MLKFLGGLNFAHLRGLSRAAAKAEEAARSDTDECEEEEMEAEQEQAEAEADKDAGAEETESKKDGKAKKAKKAKKSDDDDEDDDSEDEPDDEENKKATSSDLRKSFSRGRKLERARGAAIFSAPAAAQNVELAAKLAFDGEYAQLSSAAAIAILDKSGSGKGKGLSGRMEGAAQPKLGPSGPGEPDKAKAIEASWEHAAKDFMPKP